MSSSRKPRARTERRAQDRRSEKLTRDLERLAALEPGGAPDRPIEVASASLVEVRAAAARCTACGAAVRVEEHTAETLGGALLRVARVRCPQCRRARAIYFRLVTAAPN